MCLSKSKWSMTLILVAALVILFEMTGSAQAQNMLNVPFFSQRKSQWSGNRLGTCPAATIGSDGCAETAVAMALGSKGTNVNPASLNTWLTQHQGYVSGCTIDWIQAANYDGPAGLTWIDTGTLPTTPAGLKAMIDRGERIVAKSTRSSSHWVIIVGYLGTGTQFSHFMYYDPWDLQLTARAVGDGWVSAGTPIRRYR